MINSFGRLFILIIFFSLRGFGQEKSASKFTGTFEKVSFETCIQKIEKQFGCYFYYDKTQTDSINVSATITEQTLPQVLETLASKTGLKFSADNSLNVFVTKENRIQTKLPFKYFESETNENTEPEPEYFEKSRSTSIKSALESRVMELGSKSTASTSKVAVLSGIIKDEKTGEPVIGGLVYADENQNSAVSTDKNGYFKISLLKGKHELKVKSIGMKSTKRQIILYSDSRLNIDMKEDMVSLNEVVITDKRTSNVESMQMGIQKLEFKTLKQVPSIFGETDVIRVIMALPGVQTAGENSTGLIVRGGGADQNLILFNDSPIFNPSHLFGFFSSFNPDVIKDVELHKSSIPAEYGGRLSSVLKINSRDGNMKKFGANAGIGLLTGKLTIEAPIIKDKISFIAGVRGTYSDWILKQVPINIFQNSAASFYDLNGQVTYNINPKNTLRVFGYLSNDKFKFSLDTQYTYSNSSLLVKWNKIFKNNVTGEFTAGYSGFDFSVTSEKNPINAYKLTYAMSQYNFKADFKKRIGHRHHIDFGAATALYKLKPGDFAPLGDKSVIKSKIIENEKGVESAVYVADNIEITPRFSVYAGLRFSMFNYLGAKNITTYQENAPRNEDNVLGIEAFGNNQVITTYSGLEPRISAKYLLTEDASLKISYNRNRQYINQLSNATAITPTDIWKLSDTYLRPQVGDQVSLGLYKNLKQNTIELSAEVYYKNITDAVDYKNGALLLLNQNLERDVVNAHGKAYGAEFMVKKTAGRINGWVSYTYSRSFVQIDNPALDNVVNRGNYFPGNFDKPHSINFIANYKITKRLSFSLNMVYSTGRPITLPDGKYQIHGIDRIFYSDRNQYRIPDYFRTDISFNLEGNHNIKQKFHNSWAFSIYNLTGRKNVYSIFFKTEANGELKGYQMSIFGIPIPTITYNLKF